MFRLQLPRRSLLSRDAQRSASSAVLHRLHPVRPNAHRDTVRFASRLNKVPKWLVTVGLGLMIVCVVATIAHGENPTTQPTQSDLEFLLSKSPVVATQPTTVPTTEPSFPLRSGVTADARQGTILLSSGGNLHGKIAHTQRKPVRIWVEADKEYQDVQFASIRTIDAKVVWERLEKEWNFKESGSDVKAYSGKTYPAREMQYEITLDNGKTITGAVSEPLYLLTPDGSVTYILHKRDKGELGQSLDDLVFVKHVDFGEETSTTQPRKD
jgi:hypothetical protein